MGPAARGGGYNPIMLQPGSCRSGPRLRLLLPLDRRLTQPRRFHVRAEVRELLGLDDGLFGIGGTLLEADLDLLARLAEWLGPGGASTAELFAAMATHEFLHLLLLDMREDGTFKVEDLFSGAAGDVEELKSRYGHHFPSGSGVTESPLELLEEIVLLQLHNRNRAMRSLAPLLRDTELRGLPAYAALARLVDRAAAGVAGESGVEAQLFAGLRRLLAPQLARPDSLPGQLEHFRELLGPGSGAAEGLLDRLLLAGDLLREEQAPRFSGAPPGPPPAPEPGSLLATDSPRRPASDREWMAGTVIIAKSCLVWLDQLSERYGRHISALDGVPDAELQQLAQAGFTALWLIGIWQRSTASRTIKQLRGQPDAEASAYAVHDYVIDPAIGGEAALEHLRERAARFGLRLVSDMVPNHTGIDSRWVVEHPDWFVQLPEPPYPSYSFTGPDLSDHPGVAIRLEDHYWDGSDAAVVFERTDLASGESRYIYHGNDGTGLPWNDTAQLDYLNPEAREAVIRTMVDVARRFPIIRFDAAMTLVRRHVQRLWYPPPGQGGAIASRALHGSMPAAEFERALPSEFWTEATARIESEAPGTLLLAEAFWMLEGYFVQSLGMHRVYNSAFMHMLRDGANAQFRAFLREALENDPAVLGRLVNFMNNPDEESAAEQFGSGDRYFTVCTLLVTLPGLPMFGHGQVEGLTEKYGMEFRRSRLREVQQPEVVARHEAEVFPLLRRRSEFAQADGFELLDFLAREGVNENVIALSNSGHLVLCNNSAPEARGWITGSVPRLRNGGSEATEVSLAAALGLEGSDRDFVAWTRLADGLDRITTLGEIRSGGMKFELAGYGREVLLDFRVLPDTGSLPFGQLAARLAGRGVPDLAAAAARLGWHELLQGGPPPGDTDGLDVLPDGTRLSRRDVALLADRLRRLAALLQETELERAWLRLSPDGRLLLLIQGIAGFEPHLERLAPDAPGLFRSLPWKPAPGWWQEDGTRSWLGVHPAQDGEWFREEPFMQLAAFFALRGALRAGPEAGLELWSALSEGLAFSRWRPARLLRVLGARSDG